MNRDNDRQTSIILAVLGILPIVWLGLLIAPSVKGGLPEILPSLMNVMSDPFHIVLCEDSVKTVLVLLLCYAMGIGIYFSTQKNYRMFLFFDRKKRFKKGRLSCYINTAGDDRPKYRVSDKNIDGYKHLGRLVLTLRNYEE